MNVSRRPAPRDVAEAAVEADDFVGSGAARLFYGEGLRATEIFGARRVAIRNCAGCDVAGLTAGRARGNFWKWIFRVTRWAGWQWASRTR